MIILFDLNHVAYRCLFGAINDIKDVGWAYFKHMMYNHIFSVCKKFDATEVILCVDSKENWRRKIYPEYKQNRKAARDKQEDIDWNAFFNAYAEFVSEVKQYFPFFVLQIKYMEADDVVGVLARDWQKHDKIVITSDLDYIQLLRYNNIKIWDPIRQAFKKHDDPEKQLKIKILMGDDGDNIPAIKPRVGEKTAEKLVDDPDSLQELFEDKTPSYTKQDGTVVTLGDEYKEKFRLNTQLIDLTKIPDVLVKAVHKQLVEYQLPTGKEIFQYFTKNKFREFMRRMEEIEGIIGRVVDTPRIPKEQSTAIDDMFSSSVI